MMKLVILFVLLTGVGIAGMTLSMVLLIDLGLGWLIPAGIAIVFCLWIIWAFGFVPITTYFGGNEDDEVAK